MARGIRTTGFDLTGRQQANLAKVAITYTTGDPTITTDGTITIADGAAPSNDELLVFVEELNDKIAALSAQLQALGLQASS